jgi:integrase
MIDRSPAEDIKKFPECPRDRYPDDQEFLAVYKYANPIVRDAMEFVYFTAMSPCDMLKITVDMLTRSGVNLGYRSKVARRRATARTLFAWNEHLFALVQTMLTRPGRTASPYLFQTRHGEKLTYANFNAMFHRARTKAVEQDGITPFNFYDLRAKSLTDAENAGLNASLLGCHADERTTQIYLRRYQTQAVETLSDSPLTRTSEPFKDGVDLRPMFPV